jgi:hypothetical protein
MQEFLKRQKLEAQSFEQRWLILFFFVFFGNCSRVMRIPCFKVEWLGKQM